MQNKGHQKPVGCGTMEVRWKITGQTGPGTNLTLTRDTNKTVSEFLESSEIDGETGTAGTTLMLSARSQVFKN